jgi:glycosyltransferase involved in cell wall biosynthesis
MGQLATATNCEHERRTGKRTLISVLVPVYNEEKLVDECLKRVLNAPLPVEADLEILVVDDGSTDRSLQVASSMQAQHPETIHLLRHAQNRGKGAAIRTALEHASGEFCIIQDADLEYSPDEYPRLLTPLYSGVADAVFGSRFAQKTRRPDLLWWQSAANKLLTLLCNRLVGLALTDMETCYKAFRTSLVKSIPLRSNRFGIEPELTVKLAQRHARIYETSIGYQGRTYKEGKKIGFKDAISATLIICRYGLLQRDIYKTNSDSLSA